jgi:hypothetical protein
LLSKETRIGVMNHCHSRSIAPTYVYVNKW